MLYLLTARHGRSEFWRNEYHPAEIASTTAGIEWDSLENQGREEKQGREGQSLQTGQNIALIGSRSSE